MISNICLIKHTPNYIIIVMYDPQRLSLMISVILQDILLANVVSMQERCMHIHRSYMDTVCPYKNDVCASIVLALTTVIS